MIKYIELGTSKEKIDELTANNDVTFYKAARFIPEYHITAIGEYESDDKQEDRRDYSKVLTVETPSSGMVCFCGIASASSQPVDVIKSSLSGHQVSRMNYFPSLFEAEKFIDELKGYVAV